MDTVCANNEHDENADLIQFCSPKPNFAKSGPVAENDAALASQRIQANANKLFNNSNNWTDSSTFISENTSADSNELGSGSGGAESPNLLRNSMLYEKSILPLDIGAETTPSLTNVNRTSSQQHNMMSDNNDTTYVNNTTIKHSNAAAAVNLTRQLSQNAHEHDESNLDVVDLVEVTNDCINVDQEDFWWAT